MTLVQKFDLADLAGFLVRAKKGAWASEGGKVEPQRPDFKEHRFTEGDWDYLDSYTGYFCAPGQEIVRFHGQPVWSMAYDGGMKEGLLGNAELAKETFDFLKGALARVDESMPFRGPPRFNEGVWIYENHAPGNIKRFTGSEFIFHDEEEVFSQNYIGGLIVPK